MRYPSIPHPYVVNTYLAFTPLVTFRLRLKFVYLPHSPPLPPTPMFVATKTVNQLPMDL